MKTSSITDMRSSDLINRLVLDYNAVSQDNTTEEIGRVKQLWLDVKAHQVRSLTCASSSLDSAKYLFTWNQIKTIGVDIVLVTIQQNTEPEKPEELIDSVVGLEVWTDAGNKAGKLADYCINVKTGVVVDYLFVSNGWKGITDSMYRLPSSTVIGVGKKRIIVSDTMVQNLQQYGVSFSNKSTMYLGYLRKIMLKAKRIWH